MNTWESILLRSNNGISQVPKKALNLTKARKSCTQRTNDEIVRYLAELSVHYLLAFCLHSKVKEITAHGQMENYENKYEKKILALLFNERGKIEIQRNIFLKRVTTC